MRWRFYDTDPLFSPEWCISVATAYTPFATWAAVDFLVTQFVTRAFEAGEACS
ncbi:hypothetical protein ACFQ3P_20865 [Paraburkholderia sabiae]|jgi:hypothetical protein|uniref:Uncharacterized protein n=1 Tax=Paraburkholderia sabiae TaxID=273251 RepID=A0ABU9QBN1_9BURK|nr:hypothetical protein [Paraburkholderia sabiae]WJZ71546.1 hypothetical protein QEN71_15220 [Paraburkholderia sabiae]CAG9189755.1 hypothetical protein PSAB6_10317 [Paraburkholderia sabiae]